MSAVNVNACNIIAGAVLALCACSPGWAADSALNVPPGTSTERSSPPDACSEREVNCVINDGPPPRAPWVHPKPAAAGTAAPAAPSANSNSSAIVERARTPAIVRR